MTTTSHAINLVQNLEIVRSEQVWVSDITYIRLRYEFVYLAVIMDVFTRGIRGCHLGYGLDQSLTLIALDRALAEHTPEIHHSDQGIQYAATAYIQMLRAVDAEISMAEGGEAWHTKRGYAERLMRTIKEEEVDLSEYDDYTDAVFQLGRFLNDVYMHKRIHSSQGYLTPIEFEERWRRKHDQPPDVHERRRRMRCFPERTPIWSLQRSRALYGSPLLTYVLSALSLPSSRLLPSGR